MAKTNKYSIINNEMFIYELEPFVIENVPSDIDTIYVQEEKLDEYKQLNPTLPLAKINFLLMGIHQPVWYSDYQRVMELPDIASPELSFSASEASVNVYEVPCVVELVAVTNPYNVDVVYSVDGVEVLDPSACEISTDGSHTVTASFAGNDYYYSMEVSYALTINIVEDTMDISFANNSVAVSSYLDETWTGQLQPVTGAPQGATIVYSCEDGVIANGELTLPSAGTYTVNVEVSATHYTTATASYIIVYTQNYRTMSISFAVDSVGVTGNQGESWAGTVQSVSGAPQGATIVYSCEDSNVTISGTSIEIADEGTYTITATVSADYYTTATASYNIVYSQNDLVMNISFDNSAISETLTEGDGYEAQVQSVIGAPQDSTIVYSASTGSISNGVLALSNISDGDSVTVSATVSCPDYVTTTISYTISFTVLSIMDAYFANNSVSVSSYVDENYTGALQAVTDAPQESTITYSCENGTIANGQITLSSAGTYTVTAEITCAGYVTKTISYSIVYTQNNRTMSLSFSDSSVAVSSYADETYSGTVQSVTGAPSGATIVYSSEDLGINISGTSIDIAAAGTYTITATVSATGYTTATASYTIVYTQNNRTMSLSFSNSTISETITAGDSYSAQVQAVTGAPQGATVVYTTSDGSISNGTLTVSSISDNDVVTVTATVSATGYTTATASYTITFTVQSAELLTYTYDTTNYTATATGTIANDTTITELEIPATTVYNGDTYAVTAVDDGAFNNYNDIPYNNITTLILHEGLVSIGSSAFANVHVANLVIPDSVTTLGTSCFWDGGTYETITFGTGVTEIPQESFVFNRSLTDIYCRPTNPPTVGNLAFYELSKGNVTLHVPVGCLSTYQNASWWNGFIIVDDIVLGTDLTGSVSFANATDTDTIMAGHNKKDVILQSATMSGTPQGAEIKYSCSGVDIYEDNGTLYASELTAGTYTISAIAALNGHVTTAATYTLTVTQTQPTTAQLGFFDSNMTAISSMSCELSDDKTQIPYVDVFDSLVNASNYENAIQTEDSLSFTWSSSDSTIADVDVSLDDGIEYIYFYDTGTVTLTCTWAGNTTYPNGATKTLSVTITQPTIEFSNSSESATIRASQSSTTVNLQGLNNVPSAATVSYSCGNYTVNAYENIYYIENMTAGTYTVSATVTMNGNTIGTDSYTLTVSQTQPTTAVLEFYDSSGNYFGSAVEYDVSNASIELPYEVRIYDVTGDTTNPHDVMPVSQQDAVFTWSSDAAGVADIGVDENTGDTMIFLYGEGTANITCTWAGNSTYPNGAEKSFELTVTDLSGPDADVVFYDSAMNDFVSSYTADVSDGTIAIPTPYVFELGADTSDISNAITLTAGVDDSFSWSSEDASVADVVYDENTGEEYIELYAEGTTSITCTWSGNESYPNGGEGLLSIEVTDANSE